jgi:hypothetical protein
MMGCTFESGHLTKMARESHATLVAKTGTDWKERRTINTSDSTFNVQETVLNLKYLIWYLHFM